MLMKYKTYYNSPLGRIIIVGSETHITVVFFENSRYSDVYNEPNLIKNDDLPIFIKTKNWLNRYFNGENPDPKEIPTELHGSEFAMQVWEILKQIPYGQTVTYGEIAKKIAEQNGMKKMSAQAVGGAVGRNPISIIVPCHRVIGANGNLTGYAGGIDRKIKLLEIEKGSYNGQVL